MQLNMHENRTRFDTEQITALVKPFVVRNRTDSSLTMYELTKA
jgi:hypothetical protein